MASPVPARPEQRYHPAPRHHRSRCLRRSYCQNQESPQAADGFGARAPWWAIASRPQTRSVGSPGQPSCADPWPAIVLPVRVESGGCGCRAVVWFGVSYSRATACAGARDRASWHARATRSAGPAARPLSLSSADLVGPSRRSSALRCSSWSVSLAAPSSALWLSPMPATSSDSASCPRAASASATQTRSNTICVRLPSAKACSSDRA